MKIGELAERTGCRVETIRYYEQQGLLPEPGRTEGNYRDYNLSHLERLSFIRNCRGLDMAHTEVKVLLHFLDCPKENCGGVNELLEEHIVHVQRRIEELMVLKQQLVRLREQCSSSDAAEKCNILHDLSQLNSPKAHRTESHLTASH